MRHRYLFGIPAILLFALTPLLAEAPKDTEVRLLKDLKVLTNDDCEGRGISTKGINLAAEHIARSFAQAGLKPGGPDGTYFQPFTLITGSKLGDKNELSLVGPQGQTLTLDPTKHFTTSSYGGAASAKAPLVFVGYGITSKDPAFDDYAGLDVAGKIVVLLTGTPRRGQRYADTFAIANDNRASLHGTLRTKIENAEQHKAAGVLIVEDPVSARFRGMAGGGGGTREGTPPPIPVAQVRRDVIDSMLVSSTGQNLALTEKLIDIDLKPRSAPLTGWSAQVKTDIVHNKITVKNVVGVVEGSGPLAKETVVIGAHYDHVGFGTPSRFGGAVGGNAVSGPGSPGGVGLPLAQMSSSTIHKGADDNASGTTALMELARRFGSGSGAEGRRLVFIAFTGEESGLLGSAYYTKHPIAPLADTTTMVNMDMVGRLQDNKLMVGGLGSGKPFLGIIERLNEKHKFDLAKEPSGQGPSDHANFYAQKIPVLKFFTGFHEQYHRPTDRLETINLAGMARVVDLIADAVAAVRTLPERPEYAKTSTFNRTTTLWANSPSTGIMPDYSFAKEGVLVDGVVPNTAAAKAGVKKGDRLVAVADKPLKDAGAFLEISRSLKLGEKVALTLERDGKALKLEMQLAKAPSGLPDLRFGYVADYTDIKDGILVTEVPENSPAAKAGLKKGDRITAIGGEPIVDAASYLSVVRSLQPKEIVQLTVTTGGKSRVVAVTTADTTARGPGGGQGGGGRGQGGAGRFGFTPDFRDMDGGILVGQVREDSPAAAAGLKVGDRIKAVNGKAVEDLRALGQAMQAVGESEKVELTIQRNGKEAKIAFALR